MEASDRLIEQIKEREGYTPIAEHLDGDKEGVITGGYGDTHVELGETHTQAEWEARLRSRVGEVAEQVHKLVKATLHQSQFDALVDFAYNVGIGNLSGSTLLRKLNENDLEGAWQEFPKWNKANGKVLPGLVARREEEASEFAEGEDLEEKI